MNRGQYEALKASVKTEAWDAIWEDSYDVEGGEAIRRQMVTVEGVHAPLNAGSPSVIDGIIDRLYSGAGGD